MEGSASLGGQTPRLDSKADTVDLRPTDHSVRPPDGNDFYVLTAGVWGAVSKNYLDRSIVVDVYLTRILLLLG